MAQCNEIVVLHVPFNGDRYITARMLETFIREQLAEKNLTKKCGELAFVDIPFHTNEYDPKCMAFLRFQDTRVHPMFVSRFNGIYVTKSDRLTTSISTNNPMTLSSRYLQYQIAWVHPQFLAEQSERAETTKTSRSPTRNRMSDTNETEIKSNPITVNQDTTPNQKSNLDHSKLKTVTDQTLEDFSPALKKISSPKVAHRLESQNLNAKLLTAETENSELNRQIENLQITNMALSSDSVTQTNEISQLKNKIVKLEQQIITKDMMLDESKKKFIDFKNRVMSIRTFRH